MKYVHLALLLLVTSCAGPRVVRDPKTGVFRDTVTGECFIYQAVGVQAWTVNVPCGDVK